MELAVQTVINLSEGVEEVEVVKGKGKKKEKEAKKEETKDEEESEQEDKREKKRVRRVVLLDHVSP